MTEQRSPSADRPTAAEPPEGARSDAVDPLLELGLALRVFAPVALAALVFVGGLVLLFSVSVPETGARTDLLRDVVPLPFAEASHLSASLAGLALIVLARGLALRMQQARLAATAVLLAGAVFALLKGLDWEAAGLLVAVAGALTLTRREFYRRGDWRSFGPGPGWLILVAMSVAAVAAVGFLGYHNTAYRNELWWHFAWKGDAPRFLRAMLVLAVAIAALSLDALINRPMRPRRAGSQPVPPEVRQLLADSPHSARHLALLGDKQFLLAPGGDAFLMYGTQGRSRICLGGPVGAAKASEALVWRFVELAHRDGMRPVFCAVTGDRIVQMLDLGHAIIKMGEVARVNLTEFSMDGPARKSLRYARSRAERDGLAFAILPRHDVPAHLTELRAVSDAWLATRKGREKGFALGSFRPDYLREFDFAVMRKDGRIVAFANLWRSGGGEEMAIDLMRHLPDQSPVLMEAFFADLFLLAQSEGFRWFNLGGAPLSGMPDHPLAPLWARIGSLIYRRGDDLYSFEGLRSFKQKFGPVWVPQYITCPRGLSVPRVLIDLGLLVSRPPAADAHGAPMLSAVSA